MIVLDYVKKLKQAVKEETETFSELLEKAETKEFPQKEMILYHFSTVERREKEAFLHLFYNKKHMFKTPWDEFYMTTRAIVLDWKKEEVVLYPFDKFFELDEHKSTKQKQVEQRLEEATLVEVTEKIDGSLIVMRYYQDEYFIVSSGSLNGPHVEIAKRLLEQDNNLKEMLHNYLNYTFMIEMKNTEAPQLIKYGEDKLTIIGMRNMDDFRLLSRKEIGELAKTYNASVAPDFDLSVAEMMSIMEDPTTTNNEGYILRLDDFLVKMKTKNFILANRFGGDPARNFNMVIQCIREGRLEAVRPMVNSEYTEAFDKLSKVFFDFAQMKEEKLNKMFSQLPDGDDMALFAKEAKRKFFKYEKDLVALKSGYYQAFTKKDLKNLKPIANYFTCVAHHKYAELNDLHLADVEKDIANGNIQYLKKYEDTVNNRFVYILHKWQWFNEETLTQIQEVE